MELQRQKKRIVRRRETTSKLVEYRDGKRHKEFRTYSMKNLFFRDHFDLMKIYKKPIDLLSSIFDAKGLEKRYRAMWSFYERLVTELTDEMARDMIYNNVVIILPSKYAFMCIAETSATSSIKKGLAPKYIPHFIFMRNGNRFAKEAKLVVFTKKYQDMLDEEIAKGHSYENIDIIVERLKYA